MMGHSKEFYTSQREDEDLFTLKVPEDSREGVNRFVILFSFYFIILLLLLGTVL